MKLSITHISFRQKESEVNFDEPGDTSPHNSIAKWRIATVEACGAHSERIRRGELASVETGRLLLEEFCSYNCVYLCHVLPQQRLPLFEQCRRQICSALAR